MDGLLQNRQRAFLRESLLVNGLDLTAQGQHQILIAARKQRVFVAPRHNRMALIRPVAIFHLVGKGAEIACGGHIRVIRRCCWLN